MSEPILKQQPEAESDYRTRLRELKDGLGNLKRKLEGFKQELDKSKDRLERYKEYFAKTEAYFRHQKAREREKVNYYEVLNRSEKRTKHVKEFIERLTEVAIYFEKQIENHQSFAVVEGQKKIDTIIDTLDNLLYDCETELESSTPDSRTDRNK